MVENSYKISHEFPFGERYRYSVTPFREIQTSVPSIPGLYSWHFRLPQEPDPSVDRFLQELYLDRLIDIRATGNMRQVWRGPIRSERDALELVQSDALRECFFALAFPIYIGISRDLRGRLMTHTRELEKHRLSDMPTDNVESEFESDTDAESKSFGQRLGAVFRRAGYTNTRQLFVKHYAPALNSQVGNSLPTAEQLGATMKELGAAESVLNTLFHPALGRR